MTRAVVDAKVFISALISPEGVAARLVQRTANRDFELVMSPRLVWELATVTRRPTGSGGGRSRGARSARVRRTARRRRDLQPGVILSKSTGRDRRQSWVGGRDQTR
ncbi:MAG: PIN domain-containing protein [Actinobacteria bacterium]|nr:PIN domain-containing protein [Actinomycetota bacterium]